MPGVVLGATRLEVHTEQPGDAGAARVPRQRLQRDAAQPRLSPVAGKEGEFQGARVPLGSCCGVSFQPRCFT